MKNLKKFINYFYNIFIKNWMIEMMADDLASEISRAYASILCFCVCKISFQSNVGGGEGVM